jgi:hypothetical protein
MYKNVCVNYGLGVLCLPFELINFEWLLGQ